MFRYEQAGKRFVLNKNNDILAKMRKDLLSWYDLNGRTLPWRAAKGQKIQPYHVLLSEIMLQQTTVATVGPYFEKFVQRWPSLSDLACADLDEILHGWQGLGYYARARNLHLCAKMISEELGGKFPEKEDDLKKLPGIGIYTAAAISAIAFGNPANVVDGNVERVIARIHALKQPLKFIKSQIRDLSAKISPTSRKERPGDFAQAVMDLGATICTPRKPNCRICPWRCQCKAFQNDLQELIPARQDKKSKPKRYGIVFWVKHRDAGILMKKRPNKGLLGGMVVVPSTEWVEKEWSTKDAQNTAPFKTNWKPLPGVIKHTFTHFHLELSILAANVSRIGGTDDFIWVRPEKMHEIPLPTVMKKVVQHVLKLS